VSKSARKKKKKKIFWRRALCVCRKGTQRNERVQVVLWEMSEKKNAAKAKEVPQIEAREGFKAGGHWRCRVFVASDSGMGVMRSVGVVVFCFFLFLFFFFFFFFFLSSVFASGSFFFGAFATLTLGLVVARRLESFCGERNLGAGFFFFFFF
jgi:hypothetical protein